MPTHNLELAFAVAASDSEVSGGVYPHASGDGSGTWIGTIRRTQSTTVAA